MFCAQCGAQLRPGARFCATCGATVGATEQQGAADPYAAPPPPPGQQWPGGQPQGQPQWPGASSPGQQWPGGPTPGMGYGAAVATEYADFGSRLVALILDVVILLVVGIVIGLPLSLALGAVGSVLTLAIQGAYFVICMSQWEGQTVGARIMNVRVVDANGGYLTPTAAIIRFVVGYAGSVIATVGSAAGSGALVVLGLLVGFAQVIQYLMMLWDPKKQTLHDKAAGSYVIKVHR